MGLTWREPCSIPQNYQAPLADEPDRSPWFALVVKPQHEHAVESALSMTGIEAYLPLYTAVRRWSDRTKRLQLPLFAGYVFSRFDRNSRVPVLRIPGVRSIVSFGHDVPAIPDGEIETVRRMLASGNPVEPWPFLKIGQKVRINTGALNGIEGVLQQVRDGWRVVVSVEMLQRSVAVQIDRAQITPLGN